MKVLDKTLTSNEVAEMVGKEHSKLLRDIKTYIGYLGEAKIGSSSFFIESTYITEQNKEQPNYLLTKQGCEMVSNKLTGAKGVQFTAKYVSRFNEMENHIKEQQSPYKIPTTMSEALEIAMNIEKERLALEHKVDELQPKADCYDKILNNPGLVTISTISKNYGMAASAFNKLLHEMKIQYNQSGTWLLYSKYQNEGYTHVEPFDYKNRDGIKQVKTRMKWTQKGHMFLYEQLKKRGVLPLIELVDESKKLEVVG